MERTNHVMLVGEGAHHFAMAEGFQDMNLLTEPSRLAWLAWKASTSFNWRPGIDSPEYIQKSSIDGVTLIVPVPIDSRSFAFQGDPRDLRDRKWLPAY